MKLENAVTKYLDLGSVAPDELFLRLISLGLSYAELGDLYGVTEETIKHLVRDNPQFLLRVEEARMRPNFLVEQALFRRATGYKTQDIHIEQGKPVKVTVRDVFPDVVACIFWLKNRDPKRWKDSMDINVSLRDRMARAHGTKAVADEVIDAEIEK